MSRIIFGGKRALKPENDGIEGSEVDNQLVADLVAHFELMSQ